MDYEGNLILVCFVFWQLPIIASLSFTVIAKYWRASKRNWTKRINEWEV